MNDVLNSADYTATAWLNRTPLPAWWLLVMIGVGSNLTIGLGAKRFNSLLLAVLPLTVAVSLFLIADIDSPRGRPGSGRATEFDPAGGVAERPLSLAKRPRSRRSAYGQTLSTPAVDGPLRADFGRSP
jgi:purine-cytosine permease-like protein